jgi:hypothetical protein
MYPSKIDLAQQNYSDDEEAMNQLAEYDRVFHQQLHRRYGHTSASKAEINVNELKETLDKALLSATHWPKTRNQFEDFAWIMTGDEKYLEAPSENKELDGISSLDHDAAKKLIEEIVDPELIKKANRGNVKDTIKTTCAKQLLVYPTRLVIGGAIEGLNRAFPEPTLIKLPSETTENYAHRLGEFKLSDQWQEWYKNYGPNSDIRKAAKHVAGTARGIAHFGAHILSKNFDASTSSSVVQAKSYWGGGKYEEALSSLQSCISHAAAVLDFNELNLPPRVVMEVKNDLQQKTVEIQRKLDCFLEEQKILCANDAKAFSLAMAFAAEIVDTAGKYIIASAISGTAAGSPLAATAVTQLWSLASYPMMDGIEKCVNNYNNTTDIAKLALLRFNQLKEECGGDIKKIPNGEIMNIAEHVQSHYKSAEEANHGRMIHGPVFLARAKLAREVSELSKKINSLKERSNAVSLDHLNAIKDKQRLGLKIESKQNELMYKIIKANGTDAAVNDVIALTEMLKPGSSGEGLNKVQVKKLIEAFSESLAFAISTPTVPAQDAVESFENLAKGLGVDVDRSIILSGVRNRVLNEINDLKGNFRGLEKTMTRATPHYMLYFGEEIRGERVNSAKILTCKKQLDVLDDAIDIINLSKMHSLKSDMVISYAKNPQSILDKSIAFDLKIKDYESRLFNANNKYEKLLQKQSQYASDVVHFTERDFDKINPHGYLADQLSKGLSHRMMQSLKNSFKYEFFSTAKNRAALGAAMIILYNGGVSQFLPKADNVIQALLIDEGSFEAGVLIAAAVSKFRSNQPPNTIGFMGRPSVKEGLQKSAQ